MSGTDEPLSVGSDKPHFSMQFDINLNGYNQCLSQDLDFFQKKELFKFFRELFAKERSYPSTAKILRMYIKCAYYMPEHIAII